MEKRGEYSSVNLGACKLHKNLLEHLYGATSSDREQLRLHCAAYKHCWL